MVVIDQSLENFAIKVSKNIHKLDGIVYLGDVVIRNPKYVSDDQKYSFKYMDTKSKKYRITNPVNVMPNGSIEINKDFFAIPRFNNEDFIYYNVIWGFSMWLSFGDYAQSDTSAILHYISKGRNLKTLLQSLKQFILFTNSHINECRVAYILELPEIKEYYNKQKEK